jgi:hypothetical protein
MSRAVLLCPGPSLDPELLDAYHALGDVYAVNRALRAYLDRELRPVAAFLMDKLADFHAELPVIRDPSFRKYIRATRVGQYEGCGSVTKVTLRPPSPDPFDGAMLTERKAVLNCPLLTTLVAWQVLVLKEYRTIYLVGCDCQIGDRTYFCDHTDEDRVTRAKRINYGKVHDLLKQWVPYAEARGAQTINLSPGSRLSDWMTTSALGEVAQ